MDVFSRWPNLAAMMLGLAAERGGQTMLRQYRDGAWQSVTWAAFAEATARVAAGLDRLLPHGSRVLLVSESRPEVPMANIALQAIGAVPVPAYPTNLPADHAHLLRDCGARAAIVSTRALAERVLQGAAMAGGLDVLVCMEPTAADGVSVVAWDSLLAAPDALKRIAGRAGAVDRNDIAVLMYTSGTGGAPKGVLLPHRAILSNCAGVSDIVAPLKLAGEAYLSILPLSHTYEYTVGQYILPAWNCEVVFSRGVEFLASDMQTIRPHIMTVVPRILDVVRGRVLAEVARAPAWKQKLFGLALAGGLRRIDGRATVWDRALAPVLDRMVAAKVRARFGGRLIALVSGGARLDPAVGRFFQAMGLPVMQGYGQTEAGPVISCNPIEGIRVETVGPPLRGVEVRIADDGEILVRGELVMLGYLNQMEETARVLHGGWLHTGDIGVMEDLYLRITDRKKDIIVLSGGENVSPARIEGLLMNEPEIAQAVVLGDGAVGLTALVVAAEGSGAAAVDAAVKRVNGRLSGAEKIRKHVLHAPFTLENGLLTPTQKIRRTKVIAQFRERT